MPGVNGIEGLQLIRGYNADINVIMLTIFDDDEKIFQAICNGAKGYLLKKTSPSKILESINEVYNGGAPITSSIARKILQLFPKPLRAVQR